MKVDYYLNEESKENLYCRISDGTEQVSFSMGYEVDPATWNYDDGELELDDLYYNTLRLYKKYLTEQYEESKDKGQYETFVQLQKEAQRLTQESGIDGIVEMMFNYFNNEQDIPFYKDFVQAFEKFSKLEKGDYKVEVIDNMLHFHTHDEKVFEMDTLAGLTSRLKNSIDKLWYDDIVMSTDVDIWNEIYADPGIEKHVFLPVMLKEWELYWEKEFKNYIERFEEDGEEQKPVVMNDLELSKQESWRRFQVFMECYNDTPDIIQLAYNLDTLDIFPLAVISMVQIFDAEQCYSEYCDLEFCEENGWEFIFKDEDDDFDEEDDVFDEDDEEDEDDEDEDDDEIPFFYIREYEI